MTSPRLPFFLALLAACAPALGQTTSFYVEPGSYSTQRESDPPVYVRNLGQAGHEDFNWLDLGLQYRARYEYRSDDLRRPVADSVDDPLFLRTRIYLGVRNVLDPLRVTVELQDSRRNGSRFAPDNREVNESEVLQGYAELYYAELLAPDARGNARPLSIRAGRQAFEALDRRLVARNEWRNTTNNFEGLRVSLGQDGNDWQLQLMTLHPVTRLLGTADSVDHAQRFNAVIVHWRRSPRFTVEPHYFHLRQNAHAANGNRARDIHAPGLRVYGKTVDAAVNYDVSIMTQFGDEGALDHQARGFTAETGYTWLRHPWRPRLSAFYGYATGDRNPADAENNRFERFFGFGRPWSANEYALYENVHAPKLRLEFQPVAGLRIDTGYSAYRLASATDRFNNLLGGSVFNRDTRGQSGDFVGDEVDVRVRFSVNDYLGANVGYTHFRTGEFTRNRQRAAVGGSANGADFLYVELTLSLF